MIEGTLVNLRANEMTDLERYTRWFNDREVTRFLHFRYPLSQLAEEGWLRENAGKMGAYDHVVLAIDTKDGTHIGSIGFHQVVPEDRRAVVGISIGDKAYWSKGYGTDAMRTLMRFGFEEMNLYRIELTVDARNERAQACYRKCGFVEEVRMRQDRWSEGAFHDTLWMGILRDEWLAAQPKEQPPS
ncbi:MAG: GNAT family N-acetyltransferase [Chloroflexota bacterium]|nr:GNAT family N-acetyltransferase [Chloroflexota bacterium]